MNGRLVGWVGLQSQCPIRSAAAVFRFRWQTKSEKKDGKEKRKHVKREKWGLAPGSSLPSRLSCCSFQFPREKIKNCSENDKNDFQYCLRSPSHNHPMKSKIKKLAQRRENVKLGKLDRQSGGLPLDVQTLHGPGAQEFTARSRCSQLLPLTNATQIQILNIYTHTHTETNTHTHRDKHTHTHIQENTHTRTQTHRRIHILICNWHGHICCDIKWQSFKFSTFPSLGTI